MWIKALRADFGFRMRDKASPKLKNPGTMIFPMQTMIYTFPVKNCRGNFAA